MPRPRTAPTTLLGSSMVATRAGRPLLALAAELGLDYSTLSRIERGATRPTYDTAVKLAAWLGWTTDEVMRAANSPAQPPGDGP